MNGPDVSADDVKDIQIALQRKVNRILAVGAAALVVIAVVGALGFGLLYTNLKDNQRANCEEVVVIGEKLSGAIEKVVSGIPPGQNPAVDQLRVDLAALPDHCSGGVLITPHR